MEKKRGRPSWKEKAGLIPEREQLVDVMATPSSDVDASSLEKAGDLPSKKASAKKSMKLSGYVAKTAMKCTSGAYNIGDELPLSDIEADIEYFIDEGIIAPMYGAD